jgi:hypothetical protein
MEKLAFSSLPGPLTSVNVCASPRFASVVEMFDRKSPATFSGRIVVSSTTIEVGAEGGVRMVSRTVAGGDSYFPSLTLKVN